MVAQACLAANSEGIRWWNYVENWLYQNSMLDNLDQQFVFVWTYAIGRCTPHLLFEYGILYILIRSFVSGHNSILEYSCVDLYCIDWCFNRNIPTFASVAFHQHDDKMLNISFENRYCLYTLQLSSYNTNAICKCTLNQFSCESRYLVWGKRGTISIWSWVNASKQANETL